MYLKDRWTKDSGYFGNTGTVAGYGIGGGASGIDKTYVIPCHDLIPLFSYGRLLPPNMVKGLRVRFTIAPAYEIVVDAAVSPAVWTVAISDFKVVLDTYTMDQKITESVHSNPIEIEFISYKHQEESYIEASAEIPFQYELTKAMKVCAITRLFSVATPPADIQFLFGSDLMSAEIGYEVEKYQWRVGNSFQPHLPIENAEEAFVHSLRSFNQYGSRLGHVGVDETTYDSDYHFLGLDLSRSASPGGGTPIDNGSPLELHLTHTSAENRVMSMFVVFLKRLVIKPVSEQMRLGGLRDKVTIFE